MCNSRNFDVQIKLTEVYLVTVAADKDTSQMDIMDDAFELLDECAPDEFWVKSETDLKIL